MNPLSLAFYAWLLKKLWTPKPTHQVLGLPPPIACRVLLALNEIDGDTPADVVEEIHAQARETLWRCLRERNVPDNLYELVIRDPIAGHRVRRRTDHCSWSLVEFDDFIDLALNTRGTPDT